MLRTLFEIAHDSKRSCSLRFGEIAMDVASVRTCIRSTVDPNANTRRQAELNLKNVGLMCHFRTHTQ